MIYTMKFHLKGMVQVMSLNTSFFLLSILTLKKISYFPLKYELHLYEVSPG